MSCITQLLEMKGNKECLLLINHEVVIEGGGVYKEYEYLITFTDMGSRCGYVAIPDGQTINIDEIECHGGITFEGTDHNAKDLLPIKCNDLWIGFDCAHFGDMRCHETARKYFSYDERILEQINVMEDMYKEVHALEQKDLRCSHKTFDYLENECKHIIDQILTIKDRPILLNS